MHKKLREKLRAKFPAITRGYSMVKFAHLDEAFFEVFLTASKPIRRPITAAKRKEKGKRYKSLTWKDVGHFIFLSQNFDFYACLSQNVVKTQC